MFIKTIYNNIFIRILIDIITAITPYIVLIVTIKNSKKNFETQLKSDKENYESQLYELSEATRLSILPYLALKKDSVKFSHRKDDDIVDIDLTFINKGNGTASNIKCKNVNDLNNKSFNIVSKTFTYHYYIAVPFDWYSNIAMINETVKAKIMFEPRKVLFDTKDTISSDQFKFKILFKDIQGRQYEQEFFIQFHINGNEYSPLLVESFDPQCI